MATVYLAQDLKHEREVAIKVLRDELADVLGRERFAREIRLASSLQHPHILPLLDSGDADGLLYFVMPVVRGESWRVRLERGAMPVAEAVRLTVQVAGALDYAHRAGVAHRDIKPENILLQDGQALVVDFGIGRALGEASGSTLTQAGIAVGTPAYMSPEQAVGEAVDGRSDQYSLACVLYESLVGEPPFTGPSAQAVIAKRFVQTPADVHALREGVPRTVARAIQRALQRTAIDRFETLADFANALAEPDPAAQPSAAAAPPQSVAVMAFESPGADADDVFFAEGITEEILTSLARHPELRVAGRASSFSFKGRAVDPRVVGEQLGVRTILEGSVRRSKHRVRISARLIDTSDGYQLWSERYDRELVDVFAVQDEIATSIASQLRATLAVDAPMRRQRTTASVEAYEAYLKGRSLLYRRGRHIPAGLALLENALQHDPTYALAWAGICDTYSIQTFYGFQRPQDLRERSREASEKALQFGPDLAEANAARGLYELTFAWNWSEAERYLRRAYEIDPAYIQGTAWYAFFVLGSLRREWDKAEVLMRQLVQRDPLSAYVHAMMCATAGFGTGTDAGIVSAKRAAELDSEALSTWHCALCAYSALSDANEVRRVAEQCWTISGRAIISLGLYGLWCAQHDDIEGATLILDELCARAPRAPALPGVRGLLAVMIGDEKRAAVAFDDCLRQRDPQLFQYLHLDIVFPKLRALRAHAGWQHVLRESGLLAYLEREGLMGWQP